jgi:uncharacterized protein YjdB
MAGKPASSGGGGGATLQTVTVSPSTASIKVGAAQAFTATGNYSDGSTQNLTSSASWTSSNTSDATVQTAGQSNAGTATGVAKGSAVITASISGLSGAANLSVSSAGGTATLTSIAITPATAGISISGTVQFTATGQYSDGSTKTITSSVTWTSSNTADATINSAGLATGIAGGTVTITAALTGVSGTASLGVTSNNATVTSVSIDPVDPSLAVGQNQQFFATANYSDGTTQDVTATATWSSSSNPTATVETAGQQQPGDATGVAVGTASIAASTGSKSGSTTLTVIQLSGNGQKIPLMDMTASQNYLSFAGGLYENSSDTVPSDHDADGRAIAGQIQPLDTNGNPSATGTILFTSIGMSNAADEFGQFIGQATKSSQVNQTSLQIVNGAKGGITACMWVTAQGSPPCSLHTENQFDRVRDDVLTPLGLTEQQVQIVWIKEANGGPGVAGCGNSGGQPCDSLCNPSTSGCQNTSTGTEAVRYELQLGEILRAAKQRWPNLKLAFISTRIYAGYATDDLSPEPYCYEYGFSAKWFIQAQINQIRTGTVDPTAGDLNYNNGTAPWVSWSAYIWANGPNPRSDGLVWCNGQSQAPCSGEVDFQTDGTHPNSTGQQKVATMLMNYFLSAPYSLPWFAAP